MSRRVIELVPKKEDEEKHLDNKKVQENSCDKVAPKKEKKRKNTWRRVKNLTPFARIVPYIMEDRIGSQNFVFDEIDMYSIDKYVKKKQQEGLKYFNLMHVIIAGYIRTVSQFPGLNRFIRGQKIYTRELIEVSLVIKKEMSIDSPDTVIKVLFEPDATAEDVYNELNRKIEEYRQSPNSSFDKLAKMLNFIPGLFLRWTVSTLRLMDYFGLLPKFLTNLSPFHCSFFITSMGSLGIPPIVHHLYDFGTVPVFCSFGSTQREYKVSADGSVYKRKYVGVTYNLDERICDGFYYAAGMKYLRAIFKNPEKLDTPPEVVVEDIK
ncbi:MAG: hypothetical protein IJ400_03180 [Clostridia bacterium]|nr:hypothetical protein [Clostridia bacterium]